VFNLGSDVELLTRHVLSAGLIHAIVEWQKSMSVMAGGGNSTCFDSDLAQHRSSLATVTV
jgi:hypothetical protein